MRPAILTIPQPCAKSWAAMSPTAAGRHCAACQKTVVDFTHQTDAEILAALARAASGSICGRFRAEQLDRPLRQPAPASYGRVWLRALLTAGSLAPLLAPKATAQTAAPYHFNGGGPEPAAPSRPPAPAITTTPAPTVRALVLGEPARHDVPAQRLPSSLPTVAPVVRGVVRDAQTHEPLPGVTVLLRNTTHGTSTNAAGEFALDFPPGIRQGELVASSVGYQHSARTVEAQDQAAALTITLELDTQVLGGLELVQAVRPYPWHPRALWFWLARPFRH